MLQNLGVIHTTLWQLPIRMSTHTYASVGLMQFFQTLRSESNLVTRSVVEEPKRCLEMPFEYLRSMRLLCEHMLAWIDIFVPSVENSGRSHSSFQMSSATI